MSKRVRTLLIGCFGVVSAVFTALKIQNTHSLVSETVFHSATVPDNGYILGLR